MSTKDPAYYHSSSRKQKQKQHSVKSSQKTHSNTNAAIQAGRVPLPQWTDYAASPNDPDSAGLIKVVVIGESGAGKSNLIQRLTEGRFEGRSKSTIGIDFALYEFAEPSGLSQQQQQKQPPKGGSTKHHNRIKADRYGEQPTLYKAQIWDTAGQERYRSSMTKIFYRDVAGALLVFDLTNRDHYIALNRWLDEIRSNVHHSADNPHPLPAPHSIPIVLVGNKVDQTEEGERAIQWAEGRDFVQRHRLVDYVETSAKTAFNVEKAFSCLFRNILAQRARAAQEAEEAEQALLKGAGKKGAGAALRSKSTTRRPITREGSIKLGYHKAGPNGATTTASQSRSQATTNHHHQSQQPVKQKKKCSC